MVDSQLKAEWEAALAPMETYHVRPEGMTLEEWYMNQGQITPPASELALYQGPPAGWPVEPVVYPSGSGATDVQFMPPPPPAETQATFGPTTEDEYVKQQMAEAGFVEGTYGGYYKPSTQAEKTISGPIVTTQPTRDREADLAQILGDGADQKQGQYTNGDGTNGAGKGQIEPSVALIAIAALGALAFS